MPFYHDDNELRPASYGDHGGSSLGSFGERSTTSHTGESHVHINEPSVEDLAVDIGFAAESIQNSDGTWVTESMIGVLLNKYSIRARNPRLASVNEDWATIQAVASLIGSLNEEEGEDPANMASVILQNAEVRYRDPQDRDRSVTESASRGPTASQGSTRGTGWRSGGA